MAGRGWVGSVGRGLIKLTFLITLSQMDENSKVYLVYFNCRGTGHYYRYVIYQIGVPYEEIHIDSEGHIPQELAAMGITLDDIPCVVYQGKVIKEMYPALRFLCNKFGRQDLLGLTLAEQAKISEIYCKYSKKKSQYISTFIKYVPRLMKQPENIKSIKKQMLKQIAQNHGFYQVCCQLYSNTGNFLFDHLTLVDFLLYENLFYFVNFFGDVGRKDYQMAFAYKNFFERTQFYQRHRHLIDNFKIFQPELNEGIEAGFRLMWLDKKYIS